MTKKLQKTYTKAQPQAAYSGVYSSDLKLLNSILDSDDERNTNFDWNSISNAKRSDCKAWALVLPYSCNIWTDILYLFKIEYSIAKNQNYKGMSFWFKESWPHPWCQESHWEELKGSSINSFKPLKEPINLKHMSCDQQMFLEKWRSSTCRGIWHINSSLVQTQLEAAEESTVERQLVVALTL